MIQTIHQQIMKLFQIKKNTNISRNQNTPKISSNKNNKVIVENNKQTNAKQNDSVKTGDPASVLGWLGLAVSSLGAGMGGFAWKRRKRK